MNTFKSALFEVGGTDIEVGYDLTSWGIQLSYNYISRTFSNSKVRFSVDVQVGPLFLSVDRI